MILLYFSTTIDSRAEASERDLQPVYIWFSSLVVVWYVGRRSVMTALQQVKIYIIYSRCRNKKNNMLVCTRRELFSTFGVSNTLAQPEKLVVPWCWGLEKAHTHIHWL